MAKQPVHLAGGALPAGKQMTLDDLSRFWGQGGGESGSELITSTPAAYSLVAWVYRATRIRSNAMAGMPYGLHRGSSERDATNPFTQTDMRTLLWRTEAARCLYGAAFWYKRLETGELIWLNPRSVKVMPGPFGPGAFRYTTSGQEIVYLPDDIVYLPYWNPTDDIQPGPAPAAVAMEPANLGAGMNEYAARFFAHGAITSVILSSDQIIPAPEIERVRTVWNRLYSGLRNAWRTVVLNYGLKPTLVGQKINDLAMPDLSKEVQLQVAAAFEMTRAYLVGEATNRATDEEETLKFYTNTVIPTSELLESSMNLQLWEPMGLRWAYKPEDLEAIQRNEAEKATGYVGLMDQAVFQFESGVLTRDRAVWAVEKLWSSIGLEFPKELKDEEPEEDPEPTPEDDTGADDETGEGGEGASEGAAGEELAKGMASQAVRQELRLLRKLVKKKGADKTVANGFRSGVIPPAQVSLIMAEVGRLGDAGSVAFLDDLIEGKEPMPPRPGSDEPRLPLPAVEEDITADDMDRAIRAWDLAIPNLAGIMEADVVGRTDYDGDA